MAAAGAGGGVGAGGDGRDSVVLDIDDYLRDHWAVWELWLKGRVTLSEMDTLSIDGVYAARSALASWEAAEAELHRREIARRQR